MKKEIDTQTLVIPAGVQIEHHENGLRVLNDGDIVILGGLGQPLDQVSSTKGSVTLHTEAPLRLERIEAPHGDVDLAGDLTVNTVMANNVLVGSGKLTAGAIVGEASIRLEGDELAADILATPEVEIADHVRGRATVIESNNELGPHRLKGGFRLSEYLDLFPGGEAILDRYPEVKAFLDRQAEQEAGGATEGGSLESIEEIQELEPSSLETTEHPDRDTDVLTLTDAVETKAAAAASSQGADDDLYESLYSAFLKVRGCYAGDIPAPLQTLEGMLEARSFKKLKKRIPALWNELIQYHKQQKLEVANAVTHNIQKMTQILQDRV